jgi:hypothetical protein
MRQWSASSYEATRRVILVSHCPLGVIGVLELVFKTRLR